MVLKDLESLQRLKCKLGNVREYVYDSPREIRPYLILNYSIIFSAIIESIWVSSSTNLNSHKWEHQDRYRRGQQREARIEAREWLMSDGPREHWQHITKEDWEPVRDLIRKLWHDFNKEACALKSEFHAPIRMSQAIRKELYKVGIR